MKKRLKLFWKTVFVLVFFGIYSCNDFLEKQPNSKYDTVLSEADEVSELLAGAYPSASYYAFLEPRTDNADLRTEGVFSRLNTAMYFWNDFDEHDIDSPLNYWISAYSGIAKANHALEILKKQDKSAKIKALYAEAFLLRAYLHFMLVNIWGKPYNLTTSASDLGIPYVLKPEKNAFATYKRATVQQVYSLIEKDLQRGLSEVSDSYYKHPKYRFNKLAAYAFASRFYLYTGQWEKAIAYSNYVLGVDYFSRMRDWKKYREQYVLNYFGTSHPLGRVYFSKEESSNLLIGTVQSRISVRFQNEKYGFTRNKADEIFHKGYSFQDKTTTWGYSYSLGKANSAYVDKFYGIEKFSTSSNILQNNIYVNNALFTLEEVLLNRAESYIMSGDYYRGTLDVQQFIKKRKFFNLYTYKELQEAFTDALETHNPFYEFKDLAQASLVKVISELRRKEFIHEGLRWFDIRRYDLIVDRNKLGEAYDVDKVLIKKDSRKVLQLPQDAISHGLIPN